MISNSKNTCICIPARLESTRFPRKLLSTLPNGLTVIQNTVFGVSLDFPGYDIFVVTDSEEIGRLFPQKTVKYVTAQCDNGTERIAKAVEQYVIPHEYVINVQGDNLRISPNAVQDIKKCDTKSVTTLAKAKTTTFIDSESGLPKRGFKHIGLYKYTTEALYRFLERKNKTSIDFELEEFTLNGIPVDILYGNYETYTVNYEEDLIEQI